MSVARNTVISTSSENSGSIAQLGLVDVPEIRPVPVSIDKPTRSSVEELRNYMPHLARLPFPSLLAL